VAFTTLPVVSWGADMAKKQMNIEPDDGSITQTRKIGKTTVISKQRASAKTPKPMNVEPDDGSAQFDPRKGKHVPWSN
jgi:hypothetical protein